MKIFQLSVLSWGFLCCVSAASPAFATPTILDHSMSWSTYQSPTPPGGRPLSPVVQIDVKYTFDNPDVTYDDIDTNCKLSRYYGGGNYYPIYDTTGTFSAPPQITGQYTAHFIGGKVVTGATYYGEYYFYGNLGGRGGGGYHTY